ncbi:SDR family NAD(P)-dependent oxidoreductase [Rhodobacterales bacterium HKCCSP123]|nr:SDR family NAD(P)-dependent oxidoreductase [Rhodobacterales bacterium HKCCSP123]
MGRELCAIIGFGPGLGTAYAEVFRDAGYNLALLSRSGAGLDADDASGQRIKAFTANAGDPENLKKALRLIEAELGQIDVVIYNADLAQFGSLEEVSELGFEESWRVGALGLFTTAKYLGPKMVERGLGTIIVSGATAALRGNVWTTAFAPSKGAQRILANALAKQLGPKGVHVSYIVIDGVIDTEDTRTNFAPNEPDEFFMKPQRIAEAALMLVRQDKSAWTFELDLRPFGEKW